MYTQAFTPDRIISIESCGRFVIQEDALVGFEPADDNVISKDDFRLKLKNLICPKVGFTSIANGVFNYMEVVGSFELPNGLKSIGSKIIGETVFNFCVFPELEIPSSVTSLGNFVLGGCKIGALKIYPPALKCEYGRQFKGSYIDRLYLPEYIIPWHSSQFDALCSMAANACEVKAVYLGNSEPMSWTEFKTNIR